MPVKEGWTGGQYSLYRALFGLYLFVHFVHLLPWGPEIFSDQGVLPRAADSPLLSLFPNVLALADSPAAVVTLLSAGAAAALCFGIGFKDRWAAGLLWYVWACLYGRNPLISNPGLPYVGWLLLAHLFIPAAPYGSWAARGRVDPDGGWRLPGEIHAIAWLLMALGYSYSGFTKLVSPSWLNGTALARVLDNPLARPGLLRDAALALPDVFLRAGTWAALLFEAGFVFLAIFRPLRPVIWGAMLLMHLSLMALIDFADLSFGMVVLHLFTFDPAWIPGIRRTGKDMVFYDGDCGLCHGAVRFLLAEDRDGASFRMAPLKSPAFQEAVPERERASLPDSIVLRREDGMVLVKSTAVLRILASLGGYWRAVAALFSVVPRPLRDAAYDGVARVRGRLFPKPSSACPLMPPHLRSRFQL